MDIGRIQEARRLVLLLGRKKFGPPGQPVTAALDAISDLDRLELLVERLSDVKNWKELLAE